MLPFFDFGYCLYSISLFTFALSLPASAPVSHSLSLTSNDKLRYEASFAVTLALAFSITYLVYGLEARQIAQNSCADALRKIGRRADPVVFGTASLAHEDVTVPLRYLSDDGLCAFDVEMKPGANRDVSSGVAVSHAALRVWEECPRGKGYGGKATDFTEYGNLQVNVIQYEPHVICSLPSAGAPSLDSWQNLVQTMPTGKELQIFTQAERSRPGVTLLPKRYSNDECTFILSIKTPGITTLTDNWEIWGAAAAVTEMCIKYGKNGQAGMLGDDNIMALTSGPSQAEQPPSVLTMNITLPDSNPVNLFTEE